MPNEFKMARITDGWILLWQCGRDHFRSPTALGADQDFRLKHTGNQLRPGQVLRAKEGARPFAGRVATIEGLVCVGPVDLALGRLEILTGAWSDADRNLVSAQKLVERLRALPFEARAQAGYAEMLLGRRDTGDREQASLALKQARATVDELGLRGALEQRVRRLEELVRTSRQTVV